MIESVLTIIVMSTLLAMGPAAATNDNSLSIEIGAVGYDDLDSDSEDDDIFLRISLGAEKQLGAFKINLYLFITLPSGITYRTIFFIISKTDTSYHTILAFNTATEAGFYTVRLEGILIGANGPASSDSSQRIFDPPGGTAGDPSYRIV